MADESQKVVPLLRTIQHEPDQDMVAEVERLLARVKAGEVDGIAIANTYRDGGAGCGFVTLERADLARLIGSVEHLKNRLLKKYDDLQTIVPRG